MEASEKQSICRTSQKKGEAPSGGTTFDEYPERERLELLTIQLFISVAVAWMMSASLPHDPRVWLWAVTLFIPFASVVVLVESIPRATLWLVTLDTSAMLFASAQAGSFGIIPIVAMLAIFLTLSYTSHLWERAALTAIVICIVAAALYQQELLVPEHVFMFALGCTVATASGRGGATGFEQPLRTSADESGLMTNQDPLTGLVSRDAFLAHVWRSIRWRRLNPAGHFAVMFIDLDNFKPINDQFGHKAGDVVLQRVAKRLQSRLKSFDVAGRYGGDEFVLLLNQMEHEDDAAAIAERMLAAIQEPITVGSAVTVGASIGIALSSTVHATPEDLIRDADAAMYRAKAMGKNRYMFSTPSLDAEPSVLKTRLRRLLHAWAE